MLMKAEVGQVNVSCGATAESAQIVPAKATVGQVIATTQHHGRVKSFSRVNGYGFILRNDKDAGLFFHVSAIRFARWQKLCDERAAMRLKINRRGCGGRLKRRLSS
jgi:cold shock CspA family protein